MKTLYMSDQYPCFCRTLMQMGYKIIPSKNIEAFPFPERKHADMQMLRINDRFFTLKDCIRQPGKVYPDNVLLNCLYLGGKLYGKINAIDPTVLNYCEHHQIPVIPVNQGYARCSTLIVSEHAAITADSSIEKVLVKNGVEVLRISPGHILLKGYDYGFIGGAGFGNADFITFFGNISRHPDYEKILHFCDKHHRFIRMICEEQPLTDIGGVVEANNETELY